MPPLAESSDNLKELVADVSAAYFSNTHVAIADIPVVIQQIATSLAAVGEAAPVAEAESASEAEAAAAPRMTPAQIRKTITPDAIISLEDGKRYKTLRRHLTVRGLTPDEYKAKWGLPKDYPLVSANYSAARSAMAKTIGLGQLGKRPKAAVAGGRRKAPAKV
jgi:predicted transcriptional regulator